MGTRSSLIGKILATCKGFAKMRPPPVVAFMQLFRVLFFTFVAMLARDSFAATETKDAELDKVADEFIKGSLAAHPLSATSLGLHEYDGRISEFTRLSLDAELARLKRFDERLKQFDLAKLGA